MCSQTAGGRRFVCLWERLRESDWARAFDHDPGRAFCLRLPFGGGGAYAGRGRSSRTCTLSSAPRRLSVRRMFAAGPACRGSTARVSCNGPIKASGFRPRTAREQSVLGTPIDSDEMEAGDIVAFRHPRRGYHTGIYVGDGKFIHSPRRGKSVEITSLSDPYFSSTFLGARRVSISESDAEAAQKLMALYESALPGFTGRLPTRRFRRARPSTSFPNRRKRASRRFRPAGPARNTRLFPAKSGRR